MSVDLPSFTNIVFIIYKLYSISYKTLSNILLLDDIAKSFNKKKDLSMIEFLYQKIQIVFIIGVIQMDCVNKCKILRPHITTCVISILQTHGIA